MVGIYKIESPEGGIYIGQSIDLESRLRKHKRALNSYGCFSHKLSIIHTLPDDVNQEVLDDYERLYIEQYTYCGAMVYNVTGGGVKNCKHNDSSILKINNWQKGRTLSESHKKNIGRSQLGRIHSPETIEKMKIAQKNSKPSKEASNKSATNRRGKPLSEKHKANLSVSLKGKLVVSEETKLKISQRCSKIVYQYSKKGVFIKEWPSATMASQKLKISRGDICSCARGGVVKSAGGFIWKYITT